MRHRRILNAAVFAAKVAANVTQPDAPDMAALYDYARQRSFPPPETLARKYGELTGEPFPHASIAEAGEETEVFFTVFRAVAIALEPFHEDQNQVQDDEDDEDQLATIAAMVLTSDQPAADPADDQGDTTEPMVDPAIAAGGDDEPEGEAAKKPDQEDQSSGKSAAKKKTK